MSRFLIALATTTLTLCMCACAAPMIVTTPPFDVVNDYFVGVCYGPYRHGQSPGGTLPSDAQILEDLQIVEKYFPIIRVYSSHEATPQILRLIHEHDLDIKVVVGAWLACEHAEDLDHVSPELAASNAKRNREEVLGAARLANQYPKIVSAICIGNETQVHWSYHRMRRGTLLGYLDLAHANTETPITCADDIAVWSDPGSIDIAKKVDFIIVHIYAPWHGQQLDDSILFTDEKANAVRAVHPDKKFIVGEIGWPTSVASSGEQADLIKGSVGDEEQAIFTSRLRRWSRSTNTSIFIFEMFDEPWKGGPDPAEVEKHWGLFDVHRTPKPAGAMLPAR